MLSKLSRACLITIVVALTGCTEKTESVREANRKESDQASAKKELLLFCGAGIRPPVAELAEKFQAEHGVKVVIDYAGGGTLIAKIKILQEGDLFMPGDIRYIGVLDDRILSKKSVCFFVPVIFVQKGNPKNIYTLKDLLRTDVKLGLGDATACAIGEKSRKIFAKNGFDLDELEKKLVFQSQTVNELGMHIQARSLDAVIVWDSIAKYYGDYGDEIKIPVERNIISTVAVGILKHTKDQSLAERFVDFLVSHEGREVFKRHGYRVDPPE
ncbi:MAG: molybdate ABC transporter substrate-binding protein [Deltaproteobacteria bacterium]|nr:molybdate ABC transporter substrate-binding protein [Deltaproteobacteria bacterium]